MLDLETAARKDPADAEVCVTLGDTYLQVKKKNEARAAFEQAISRGLPRAELAPRLKACK